MDTYKDISSSALLKLSNHIHADVMIAQSYAAIFRQPSLSFMSIPDPLMDVLKLKRQSTYRKRPTLKLVKPKNYDNYSDQRRKRLASEYAYRIGPAPREEIDDSRKEAARLGAKETLDIGTLDSEPDFDDNKTDTYSRIYPPPRSSKKNNASSRALLIYFSKMAAKTNKEKVDYNFLNSLITSGAHINVCDKHGQTVMHEVARNWNVDVAKFFIVNGVDMNKPDKWGRTPLHLAAAVNHAEMIDFLLLSGANSMPRTHGEKQTPIHYAAKYNAVSSLKVLIENRVDYNDRDYKGRTPIFLAAEMAQEDSARYLLDIGVPVGVFDDTGMSAIALMIEKMPHIAVDALSQFQSLDVAFRKESFYLNFLESNPESFHEDGDGSVSDGGDEMTEKERKREAKRIKRLACPSTALELAVKHCEYNVIMHPVMQQLIRIKWNMFGRLGACIEFTIHLIFCIVWSVLGILLPRDGKYYSTGVNWRVPTEIFGVFLTLFFILKQIWESKHSFNSASKFRLWRIRQIKRDLEFCHPRWSQEKVFLENEMKNVHPPSSGMLKDPWNIMEFLTYLSVLLAIITRVVHIYTKWDTNDFIHTRAYAFSLIFLWIHFMKSCRAFTTIGLFITMLGSVVRETLIFAFLCFEFLVPYTVGFWILFGGPQHAKHMEGKGEESVDWKELHNLMFSVWQITLVANFDLGPILAVDKFMAQIMVGTFYALCSMICINLHIALLTETFRQVYQNAKAHASQLQAITVLNIENLLPKSRLIRFHNHVQRHCAPMITYTEEDTSIVMNQVFASRTVKNIVESLRKYLGVLGKYIKDNTPEEPKKDPRNWVKDEYESERERYELYKGVLERDKELHELRLDVYELKCALLKLFDQEGLDSGEARFGKPVYDPLPDIVINEPRQPILYVPEDESESESESDNDVTEQINNEIFRAIMARKSISIAIDGIENKAYDEEDDGKDDEVIEIGNQRILERGMGEYLELISLPIPRIEVHRDIEDEVDEYGDFEQIEMGSF